MPCLRGLHEGDGTVGMAASASRRCWAGATMQTPRYMSLFLELHDIELCHQETLSRVTTIPKAGPGEDRVMHPANR